ncbi:DUF5677 domain-containing protein [Chloroflexota bacterium]
MSEFNEEGFLSSTIDRWSKECRSRYHDWFTICENLNRYCVQLLPQLPHKNRQEHLVVALFIRLLSLFESTIILAERCMVNETKVQQRAMLEVLFTLRAISIDETVAERYYDNNILGKLNTLRRYKRYGSGALLKGLDLDKRIEELDEIKRQKGIVPLTFKGLADKAGLSEFYVSAYSILSWTAHSNVIDIAQYIIGKSDEEIEEISWHPQIIGIDVLLLTATECVVIAVGAVNELFHLGIEKQITEYSHRYHHLAKKLTSNEGK